MPGFGVYPSALSPFGLGTPIPAAAPATGEAGCRYINPATGDYEQDPITKQLAQMPGTRQRVLLAVMTLRESASVNREFGIRLPRKMGTFFDSEMKQSARQALRHLTDTEQAIRIDSIVVERGIGGRARTTVSFTDLTTGKPDKVAV
jgi:hypothetical protein